MPLQPNNVLVELKNISLSYDSTPVLRHINLTVSKGDFVVITGPNGGGKTSLLRVLLRLLQPTEGVVEYYNEGNRVDYLKIGYLPQKNVVDGKFPITVSEVIASGLYMPGDNNKKLSAGKLLRVDEILELLGLETLASQPIGALSGGQLQRTLLGRAIIAKPELLILDEPLSYIDEAFGAHIYNLLSRLSRETTIVMVTHHLGKVSSMATRILHIDRGRCE